MKTINIVIIAYTAISLLVICVLGLDKNSLVFVTNSLLASLFYLLDLPMEFLPKAQSITMGYTEMVPSGPELLYAVVILFTIQILVYLFAIRKVNYFCFLIPFFLFPLFNLFIEPVLFRRGIFTLIFITSVPRLFVDMKTSINALELRQNFKRVLNFLGVISLLIFIIPGFYLPPFFDGIAGWAVKVEDGEQDQVKQSKAYLPEEDSTMRSEGYTLASLRITYNDNSHAWFKGSFFNPLTMRGRPAFTIQTRDPKFYAEDFGCFLLNLYSKAYPSLQKGLLPTQKNLGRLAYGPHNVDSVLSSDNYREPTSIKSFEFVRISDNGKRRLVEIADQWDIQVCH